MVKQLNITQEKFKGLKCLLFDYAYVQGIFKWSFKFLRVPSGEINSTSIQTLKVFKRTSFKSLLY